MAVAACGDRLALARGLARLEEARCGSFGLALSANGGSLSRRIRRILAVNDPCQTSRWPAGLLALALPLMLGSGIWVSVFAATPPSSTELQIATAVGKVLATHTYDYSRRESSGWVKVDGASVPVDVGVEHDGVSIYGQEKVSGTVFLFWASLGADGTL